MPGRGAHPALTRALDRVDDPVGFLVVAEPDEDLVEHDVVDNFRAVDSESCSAKRRASAQHRSTSSATPLRPSWRSAAQVANPRARRDDSST